MEIENEIPEGLIGNGENFQVDIIGILKKVNYLDPPILILIIFHLLTLFISFSQRYKPLGRSICFGFSLLFALIIEHLSEFISSKWKFFGFSENYFDDFGVFFVVFFLFPPLLNCILLLSFLLGGLIDKYIQYNRWKKAQLLKQNNSEKEDIQKMTQEDKEKSQDTKNENENEKISQGENPHEKDKINKKAKEE